MDATTLTADAPLPDDVPTLQALVRQLLAEVARLRAENEALRTRLDAALKYRFGRRSERRPAADEGDAPPPAASGGSPGNATPVPSQPVTTTPPPRRDPHGRGPLPAHLERRAVVHDLTEAEKLCPCCGQLRVCIGTTPPTEQLDLEPARFFVRRTIKKTYACQCCDVNVVPAAQRIQTAGPAQVGPIAKGLCGPGLLAHVITAKFADHTPVHRLAGQLARSGVEVARSTLGDWLAQAAELLFPLWLLLRQELLRSRVIHTDDTGVKLRLPGETHAARSHLWVYLGDADHPYALFDFTDDYTAEGPARILDVYAGYLQADALAQYEEVFGPTRARHCACWAHARRRFVAALDAGAKQAERPLELIGQLYALEHRLPPLLPPSQDPQKQAQRQQREEQRRQQRQQHARPVLDELKRWLDEQQPKVLPRSLLGQAISYALNHWEALTRYLEQGYLSIDNNLSERTLRAVALGRNNWGAFGSETGGRTAAVLYSVVGTCKHLGIDPFAYLREALPGLFALGDLRETLPKLLAVGESPPDTPLLDWLPDRWLQRRARDAPAATAAAG
jgi:transposase